MTFLSFRRPARHTLTAIQAVVAACALLIVGVAHAAEPRSRGDIVVVTVHGTVSATMAGVTTPLYGGAILQLPATIRTGHDGALELRQGNSTFAAAANTELEIPQSAASDGLIERIIQVRGNAFYNVGKRERSRLRVETPYLVAVIKGTQFNVAAQEDSTTIALFEGRLEVRATDESDVVDLHAGEIAIRHRGDVSISVLRMTAAVAARRNQDGLVADQDGLVADTRADGTPAQSGSNLSDTASNSPGRTAPRADSVTVDVGDQNRGRDQLANTSSPSMTPAGAATSDLIDVGIDASGGGAKVDAGVDLGLGGGAVAANVDVGASVAGATVDVGVGATVDLGAGSVTADIGVGADVGGASIDASVGAGVDLSAGSVTADLGAGASIGDVGVDVGAGAGVDLGAGEVTANLGAGVDAGDIGADVGVDAGIGDGGVDVDAGADVDLGGVTADADIGVDIGSDGADVDVGVEVAPGVEVGAGVEVGSGGVSVEVGVGDIDLGLDVGLGSGGAEDDDSGGGLLGGLLRRRRN